MEGLALAHPVDGLADRLPVSVTEGTVLMSGQGRAGLTILTGSSR